MDGDGRPDLLVGAVDRNEGAGRAYLVLGASIVDNTVALADADYVLTGEEARDRMGYAVAGAGGVDGDGLDDVLIGAESVGGAGAVYLLFGKSLGAEGDLGPADADVRLLGEAGDSAGWSVAGAGDVDGDGLDDVLVGAYGHDDGSGKVCLFLGARLGDDSAVSLAAADHTFVGGAGMRAGASVASAGDVDGDGRADLLMSEVLNGGGRAYLVLAERLGSGGTREISDADTLFLGEREGDWAGASVAGVGDVDGDGRDDVLIGAPYNEEVGRHSGKAYLFLGSQLSTDTVHDIDEARFSFLGSEPEDWAGFSVAGAGDVDGDERADLLIGAPQPSNTGRVYVVLGSRLDASMTLDLADADAVFEGQASEFAGGSVASAGDVDGDGRSDFLLGATGRNAKTGGAFVVLSPF